MKLPNVFGRFMHNKENREVFLSLVLSPDGVAASGWYVDANGNPHILGFSKTDVPNDTWQDRTAASDQVVASVEERIGEAIQIRKVVLGLSDAYLTQTGDIEPASRKEMKQLTQALDLTPIGFVALPQALVFQFKKDEGVPPSLILFGFTDKSVSISLYKVGSIVGRQTVDLGGELAPAVEEALKQFKGLEVLPSRILLYGMDEDSLEGKKAELLRYPWPTKANFLHFPKFEITHTEEITTAISLAGASELATTMGEEASVHEKPSIPTQQASTKKEEVEEKEEQEEIEKMPEEQIKQDKEEESNVSVVTPEELGFRKEDILEKEQDIEPPTEPKPKKFTVPIKLPQVQLPSFSLPHINLPKLSMQKNSIIFAIGGLIVLLFFALLFWVLPKATVTVLAIAQEIKSTVTVTIEPTATVADSQNKIIPGHSRDDSLSGQKTIPTSGTKKIGDPAKGNITIYNKNLTAKTFKKGSVLTASGLRFTLDSDVQVASASESIGSITFGKAPGALTASDIGPENNLPANTEFTFQETPSSVAIARNDQALAGGTSREVTVVSRADYDSLVKELTDELLKEAKEKLTTSISGSEKLIDQTIKTTVTEKSFSQELDQEAKELNGKITISVSGISYSEGDLTLVFEDLTHDKLQSGYSFIKERTKIQSQNIQVKKDGKITMTAAVSSVALPTIDTARVKKSIAGKSLGGAQEYLKKTPGVGGAEFRFRWSILPNRLPINSNNISLTVAVNGE